MHAMQSQPTWVALSKMSRQIVHRNCSASLGSRKIGGYKLADVMVGAASSDKKSTEIRNTFLCILFYQVQGVEISDIL